MLKKTDSSSGTYQPSPPPPTVEDLAAFVANTAECRTPLVLTLEDLPKGVAPLEVVTLLAQIAEVPLVSFEYSHTDDRVAGRSILEAIQLGAWLLFNIPFRFGGVEGLLRDLGRRLFTITPNDKTRPLMGRFRLIVAMQRDTPSTAVFRKLALPLRVHPQLVLLHSLGIDECARIDTVRRDVTECVVGAMFYRSTEVNQSDRFDFEITNRKRPPTAFPAAHRAQREHAEKARPASAVIASRCMIAAAAAPRNIAAVGGGQSFVKGLGAVSPAPHHVRQPTLQLSKIAGDDPYEIEREAAARELYERYASDVSQRIYECLMHKYYTMGDGPAREFARAFDELAARDGSVVSSPTVRSGRLTPLNRSTREGSSTVHRFHAAHSTKEEDGALLFVPHNGDASGSDSLLLSSVVSTARYHTDDAGHTNDGPPKITNHRPTALNLYGMQEASWRGMKAWALSSLPSSNIPPPAGAPSGTTARVCMAQHPSLLCPCAAVGDYLIYNSAAEPVSFHLGDIGGAVAAVRCLAVGLLALRDCGYAHRNVSLPSIVHVNPQTTPTMNSHHSTNQSMGNNKSAPHSYRLLVTNQALAYAPNSEGRLVADCGVSSRIYMSPESIRTGEWTYTDDSWAVGVILWQLIALLSPNASADPFADIRSERQVAELVARDDFDPCERFPIPKTAPGTAVLLWDSVGKALLCLDPCKRMTLSQLLQRLPQ